MYGVDEEEINNEEENYSSTHRNTESFRSEESTFGDKEYAADANYSNEHQQRGRNLDEFLEFAFQQQRNSSSSYHPINSNSNSTGNNNESEGNINRMSLRTFKRQWRYWCIMLALGVANSSDASEILCISYILGDRAFQETMLDSSGGSSSSGLLAGAVFLGMLLGGLIVGTMGDRMGRKPMLLLGLIFNSISGVLSAFARNVYILSLLRLLAGVGIGATVPPLFTLAAELAPPSARGFCVTVCASFWMVGSIYVAVAALWFFEISQRQGGGEINGNGNNITPATWRVFALFCALPSALGAVLVYILVPESPRFLGLEGRSTEAVMVANSIAEKMGCFDGAAGSASRLSLSFSRTSTSHHPFPPLSIIELEQTFPSSAGQDLEIRQILADEGGNGTALPQRECAIFGCIRMSLINFVRSTSKLYEPNLRRVTLPLQLVWFSLSFGSYGLLTWINIIFEKVHLENVYFNALLFAASNLPGNILSGLFMDKIGRSTSLIGSIIFASVSLMLFAASATLTYPTCIVISACCFQCFTIMAWNTIDTMSSELFPTFVRSSGLGICAASGRIGAFIAQFVNGALVGNPIRLLLVASGTLLLGALTPCLLPGGGDMTGRPVNDVLMDFNNGTRSEYFDGDHELTSSVRGSQITRIVRRRRSSSDEDE